MKKKVLFCHNYIWYYLGDTVTINLKGDQLDVTIIAFDESEDEFLAIFNHQTLPDWVECHTIDEEFYDYIDSTKFDLKPYYGKKGGFVTLDKIADNTLPFSLDTLVWHLQCEIKE